MAPADLGPVAEIEQKSASPWSAEMIADELNRPEAIVLVAELPDARISGWCCARYVQGEAELLKIAVQPDCRRNGIGSSLLQELEQLLRGHEVEAIFLEVRSLNVPALRCYQKEGFVVIGSRTGYYANPSDDALILHKLLSSHGN